MCQMTAMIQIQKNAQPRVLRWPVPAVQRFCCGLQWCFQYPSGFRSINIGSWMWAFDITKDNTGGLPTFWGQVDYFTYSYCSAGDYKMIDHNLYNEIPETDTRKQWFHPSVLISWYKFYDAGRKAMGDRTWTNDIVYIYITAVFAVIEQSDPIACLP